MEVSGLHSDLSSPNPDLTGPDSELRDSYVEMLCAKERGVCAGLVMANVGGVEIDPSPLREPE